jgi:hypothetical protein
MAYKNRRPPRPRQDAAASRPVCRLLTEREREGHRLAPTNLAPTPNLVIKREAAAPLPFAQHAAANAAQPATLTRACQRETCAPPRARLCQFVEAAAYLILNPRGDPAPAQPAPTFASVPLNERRETSAHPPSYQLPLARTATGKSLTIPFPSYAPGGAQPSQESHPRRRASAGTY